MKQVKGMYCKECWYDLSGIEGMKCPECGHPFDSNHPTSYLNHSGERLPKEVWVVLGIEGAAILVYLMTVIPARLLGVEFGDRFTLIILSGLIISMMLLAAAVFYGVCVAIFQFNSMIAGKRRYLIAAAFSPCLAAILLMLWIVLKR